MHIVFAIAGILSILGILLDAFETVVLPRRVQRSFPPDQLVLSAHLDSISQESPAAFRRGRGARIFLATSDRCR